MSKPRILVDGHVLDGKPQGSSAYIAGLYRAVAETGGADVCIACHNEASLTRWSLDQSGVDWIPLNSSNKFSRLALEMVHLQSRLSPDFSHFQYITPLIKKSKWINTLHDLLFLDHPELFPLGYRVKNQALFRLSAVRSDIILTVSYYSRDAIHRHFGISLERIHVTPNAPDSFVDAPDTPVAGLTAGRFLVYVSRFEPRKNQHALVQAIDDIAGDLDEDFRLVLVGYKALAYPALDAALERAGERVQVLSNLSHSQLTWLYRHAAGSIYPSKAEGFGMPVIEAVAAGGISYSADNTSMSELIPYVHGSFDANDPSQIRETIVRAAERRDTASCDSVRTRMLKAYSWAASAQALMEAIRA